MGKGPDVLTGYQNATSTTSMVVGHANATSTVTLFQFATATTRPFVGDAPRATGSECLSRVSLVVLLVYLTA